MSPFPASLDELVACTATPILVRLSGYRATTPVPLTRLAGGGLESPRLLAFSASSVFSSTSLSSPSPKFQRAMGMVAPAGQVGGAGG